MDNKTNAVSALFHRKPYDACALQSHVSRENLLRIFDMLSEKKHAKKDSVNGKAWSSGVLRKGVVGLKRNEKKFPQARFTFSVCHLETEFVSTRSRSSTELVWSAFHEDAELCRLPIGHVRIFGKTCGFDQSGHARSSVSQTPNGS